MNETLADRYRRIPYAEYTHAQTHPAHVGAVARLYGLRPAEPGTARILELATGRGTNLNWIAQTLPAADCLGVDLVEDGIDTARQFAIKHRVKNVTFQASDLLQTDFGDRQFDYIIAHGFMAWTPEPVQQRILEVCRDHLAPGGVALVSYNAMPGSAVRDSLRRLFLLEMEAPGERVGPDEQLAAMHGVMEFFESTLPSIDTMPHSDNLRSSLQVLRSKPREVLLHDEGGVVSEPLYLLQFTQWAAETGLAYLADADLRLDLLTLLPTEVQQAIAARGMSRLKALQYVDYLRNCPFRSSLVCRADQADRLQSQPDAQALLDLHIRSLLTAEQPVVTDDNSPGRFQLSGKPFIVDAPTDGVIETRDPLQKAVLNRLATTGDQPASFADIWQRAQSQCGAAAKAGDLDALARLVLESVCLGRMKLTLGPYG